MYWIVYFWIGVKNFVPSDFWRVSITYTIQVIKILSRFPSSIYVIE